MSLSLAFFSDEFNPSICSLYVRIYIVFTSLCTVQFNRVQWLQASQDLTVDLAVVSKVGVDCFFAKYRDRIAEIKGVIRKKKNKRSIDILFLSLSPSLHNSLCIISSLSIYLYISLCLSLSLSLSLSISL